MMKRLLLATLALILLAVLGGVLNAGVACAHDPRFACSPRPASHPVIVSDVEKSWAFYGKLAPGQRDYYTFAVTTQQRVPIGISIDARDAGNPARPQVVVSDGTRIVARIGIDPSTRFYEPFSRVSYVASANRRLALRPGSFTAVVSMLDDRAPQRYVLAIGTREEFGILELPYLLGAIYRIHNRMF